MAALLASLSTPFVISPKFGPNSKAGFKPWSTTLVRCAPRVEGCECFSRFREQSGRFSENLREDVRGLLSLYEASQLACEGETVKRGLQVLLHRRVCRVEAREYIETFERTDRRSQVLHEFTRLDFNMVQTIHQRELRELSGWWRHLGLGDHICFARDRLVESYFMAVGKMHEPSSHSTGCNSPGWDLQAAEQLPQSLRVFYAAVYNTTNQISYAVLRRHGHDITSHMRRAVDGCM
ncbi:alpha-thujene synthase TPS3, chloroplastic-like [Nymphaea colorata]|nr:alpha-thujene synthase TPS3, chloroplastic-like [Nymphaea colorata]